ncbi:chaperone protein dnaJ 11, chloroplastic [Quercus robur]|uniref:chaperone protein dnaJ 11, chloroplastic n=1 Tax=Quercus robur TaxID=38942 RepID=UPI0021613B6F|nr:chaperone protein dnaJ 11, chloroplastic [Quercus robur]
MFRTLNLPTAAPLYSSPETRFSSSKRSVKAYAATATEARPYSSSAAVHPASLYEVLRVERTASLTEIKMAYRSLAKMYHPDAMIQQHHHQDEEDKPEIESDSESDGRDFIEIHNAYATLSDPAARALYDLSLGNTTSQFSNQRGPFGFGVGFGFSAPNRTGFYPTRRWETDQCW